jgi:hypothetical protein
VRIESKEGSPTLEVYNPITGKSNFKIRYRGI